MASKFVVVAYNPKSTIKPSQQPAAKLSTDSHGRVLRGGSRACRHPSPLTSWTAFPMFLESQLIGLSGIMDLKFICGSWSELKVIYGGKSIWEDPPHGLQSMTPI